MRRSILLLAAACMVALGLSLSQVGRYCRPHTGFPVPCIPCEPSEPPMGSKEHPAADEAGHEHTYVSCWSTPRSTQAQPPPDLKKVQNPERTPLLNRCIPNRGGCRGAQSFHDLLPHTSSGTDHIATFHHEHSDDHGYLSSLFGDVHVAREPQGDATTGSGSR